MPTLKVAGQASDFSTRPAKLLLDKIQAAFSSSTDPKDTEVRFLETFEDMSFPYTIVVAPQVVNMVPKVLGASRIRYQDFNSVYLFATGPSHLDSHFKLRKIVENQLWTNISSLGQGAQLQLVQNFRNLKQPDIAALLGGIADSSSYVSASVAIVNIIYHKVVV